MQRHYGRHRERISFIKEKIHQFLFSQFFFLHISLSNFSLSYILFFFHHIIPFMRFAHLLTVCVLSIPSKRFLFFNYFSSKSLSLHAVLYFTIFFRYCLLTTIECFSFCFLCDHSSFFLNRYYLFLSFLPLFIYFASPFPFHC